MAGRRCLLASVARRAVVIDNEAGKHAAVLGNKFYSSGPAPELPPCDFQPEKYSGPALDDYMKIRKANLTPALLTYYKNHVVTHQGYMQWLWDINGKRYLDMFGGIVTVSMGHCHPKIVAAVEKQLRTLWHTTNIYLHPKIHEYAEKLAAKLPGNLKIIARDITPFTGKYSVVEYLRTNSLYHPYTHLTEFIPGGLRWKQLEIVVYFTNSGSEANDMAILMARMYTGTYDVISLRNSFHGGTTSLMGVTSLNTWRYNVPTGFGVQQTANPDPYRGPWGGSRCRDSPVQTTRTCDCSEGHCHACDMYFDQLEDVVKFSMPKGRVGAFIIESIQGVGGTVQFPKGYIKKAFDLIRSKGGVCISDEVQTGFGRTGTDYWGFQNHGVVPDIVTMAKGIGNGFPLGAVVTTPEIAATMGKSLHFNTYGGNPLSCTAGSSVMDVIEEEKIQENAHKQGTYLLTELAKLRDECETIGDVRGKGLMTGVELVKDKQSKEPLPPEDIATLFENLKDHGLLVGKGGLYGHVFRMKPPMCITKEDVDFTVAVFRKVFKEFEARK